MSRRSRAACETVAGGLGNIEVVLSEVPAGRWRLYWSFQAIHDDLAASNLLGLIRVPRPSGGTRPQMAIANDVFIPAFFSLVARNIAVGPRENIGAKVFTIPIGAQLFCSGLFTEYDVGEYPKIEGQG